MRCGQHGCACTTCQECWEDLDSCKCDLIKRTKRFLDADDYTFQDGYFAATILLREWLDGKS
jgi:protein involved in sex pheromone biosynthesis